MGVVPANSIEETGKYAAHHGRNLQTPLRRQARLVGVGPANSLEETGNGAYLQTPTRRQASLRFGCFLR